MAASSGASRAFIGLNVHRLRSSWESGQDTVLMEEEQLDKFLNDTSLTTVAGTKLDASLLAYAFLARRLASPKLEGQF